MNNTLTKNFKNAYKVNYSNDLEPEPLFDIYGNPTPETLRACYELENGLGEEMTLEEFFAELDEICSPV